GLCSRACSRTRTEASGPAVTRRATQQQVTADSAAEHPPARTPPHPAPQAPPQQARVPSPGERPSLAGCRVQARTGPVSELRSLGVQAGRVWATPASRDLPRSRHQAGAAPRSAHACQAAPRTPRPSRLRPRAREAASREAARVLQSTESAGQRGGDDAPEATAQLRLGARRRRRRRPPTSSRARRPEGQSWVGSGEGAAAGPAGKMPVAVMAEGAFSFKKLLDQCENQELEAPGGIATPPVYGQLLALYLLHNDMNNARYLWKRIPPAIKSANSELGGIWSVGQRIWQRDFPGIYTTINAHQWSETVQPIMEALRDATRRRAFALVSQAYTSIIADDFAAFVGLPVEEAVKGILEQGWQADSTTRMVMPKKPEPAPVPPIPNEQQLARLTDYVAFLEN
uniref:COP9 signalosome complex subunit 8 n=1 Tax=Canis lupus familiaris TaxID=9615 RepID=A0A8C0RNW3_CANLF